MAPRQASPVSGTHHQAILSAFEQYSLAVEDIAEDAEAAAATAAASAKARAAASTGDAAADVASESAVPGYSLGQILRARFDRIMAAAGSGTSSSISSSVASASAQAQEGAEGAAGQPASPDEVAAWLASDSTGLLKQSFAEGWGCRWVVMVVHNAKSCSTTLVVAVALLPSAVARAFYPN